MVEEELMWKARQKELLRRKAVWRHRGRSMGDPCWHWVEMECGTTAHRSLGHINHYAGVIQLFLNLDATMQLDAMQLDAIQLDGWLGCGDRLWRLYSTGHP